MRSRRLSFVVLVLVPAVLGCTPGPASPSSTEPVGLTPSAAPAPTASPAPLDRAADLRARIAAGAEAELTLLTALSAAATDGDVDGTRIGARALADWANGESAWLKDLPSDPCLVGLVDTYRDATSDLALAAINLSMTLHPGGEGEESATGDEIASRFAALDIAHEGITAAARVAIVSTCVGEAPVPTELAEVEFTPAAYLAMADEVNAAFADVRTRGLAMSDPIAAARAELEAIEHAEAILTTWTGGPSELDDLDIALGVVATLLGEVGDSATGDEVTDALRLTVFALLDVFAAAERIRAALGLPALGEGEVL